MGASRKTRAIFRAIYAAAEGVVRANGLHGKKHYNKVFKIRRGLIQGDIISPIFFILAMEYIFRTHDAGAKGYDIGKHLRVGTLGYADDVTLISAAPEKMSKRVTQVSVGSRTDGDMHISIKKTKNMHVARNAKLPLPTIAEMKCTEASYTHECCFCGRRFKTKSGMKRHMAACNRQHGLTDKEFEVDDINAVFGTPECRWFRVQWAGYKNQDTWEPERSLRRQGCEEAIWDFWTKDTHSPHEGFIADPDGVWRCYQCGKGYQHERTLKSHITRTHTKRQWRGSTLDKDTRMMQQKQLQQKKAKVNCEGEELENVWTFKSLGSQLRADGDHMHDVRVRMAIAERTAGTLRHVWSARAVSLQLKLRIYKSDVCSWLTYGSEA